VASPKRSPDLAKYQHRSALKDGGKRFSLARFDPVAEPFTTGAKTGKTYVTPLVYTKDGDRFIIIASKAGAPSNPDWYHNLVANPDVILEIGTERFKARASVTKGDERERLFNAQAKQMKQFDEYRKKTTRQIPVIVLTRV